MLCLLYQVLLPYTCNKCSVQYEHFKYHSQYEKLLFFSSNDYFLTVKSRKTKSQIRKFIFLSDGIQKFLGLQIIVNIVYCKPHSWVTNIIIK